MKPNTIKITYWILTILFSLAMFMDGIGGVTQQEAGKEVMVHLGYPMYFLIIVGIAKLLGVIAVLQTKFKTIKQWAFAGFTINLYGAFMSRAFVGDGIGLLFPIIVVLVLLFVTYYFWKKYEQLKTI